MIFRAFRGRFLAGLVLLCWLCAGVDRATAQSDPLQLTVESLNVGLGGVARAGTWTPARMSLQNNSTAPRAVICQVEMPDPDGDVVLMRRQATLSPGRSQDVWVYAHPPLGTKIPSNWRFSVIDRDSGAMLARTLSAPSSVIEVAPDAHGVRVIGMSGSIPASLKELQDQPRNLINYGMVTQHEPNLYLENLQPKNLPDRWYGMSMMQAYIWTPEEGGDPGATSISSDTIKAIHEWVRRGGHLVMILPAVEDTWSQSPLADMLPGIELVSRSRVPMPLWIAGATIPLLPDGTSPRLEVKQLKIKDSVEPRIQVLCRDELGMPLAVAGRYGFGRVTLVGVDTTAPAVVRLGVPPGVKSMWQDIFNWRCELHRTAELKEKERDGLIYRPGNRQITSIDGKMIDDEINMEETVGPLLMGAAVLFAVYWVLACPGSWYLLRKHGMERHSWAVFTLTACAFIAIAWVGAYFTRPATARVAHYSVVDFDARTEQARVISWATVFVPTHGRVRLDVEADEQTAVANGESGMLWAIGSMSAKNDATFLDSQTYEVEAGLPSAVSMPFRGTAKRIQIDWRGPANSLAWPEPAPTTQPSNVPAGSTRGIRGKITAKGDSLHGLLAHDLPGTLKDVRVIYPSVNGEPWVARLDSWRAGETLDLKRLTNALDDANHLARQPLATKALNSDENWSGYLGDLMKYTPGTTIDPNTQLPVKAAGSTLTQYAELLTFFDNLPPPRSIASQPVPIMGIEQEKGFVRGPGRVLDMSQALGLKRVIILGHLENAPMPAPLHADGKSLPSSGWTLVRWVGEVESGP